VSECQHWSRHPGEECGPGCDFAPAIICGGSAYIQHKCLYFQRARAESLSFALELAVAWMEAIVTDGTLPDTRPNIIAQAKAALGTETEA
jgi:hypothetical protein